MFCSVLFFLSYNNMFLNIVMFLNAILFLSASSLKIFKFFLLIFFTGVGIYFYLITIAFNFYRDVCIFNLFRNIILNIINNILDVIRPFISFLSNLSCYKYL